MKEITFKQSQRRVIDSRGKNMLVSASAGTGKTTVMIERIFKLIAEGADVSQMVVVTFTNLAAAEMKNRLAEKLSAKREDRHVAEQLEKLDSAAICTLHAFCSELLRNYFYVADVDPSYVILDANLTESLRKSAMDEVFLQYYAEKDEVFKKVYKIFARSRRRENFVDTLMSIYDFSRCIPNFAEWYRDKRANLSDFSADNPVITTLLNTVRQNVRYFCSAYNELYKRSASEGLTFADVFSANAQAFAQINTDNLQNAFAGLFTLKLTSPPARSKNKSFGIDKEIEEQIRFDWECLKKASDKFVLQYSQLCMGQDMRTLQTMTAQTLPYLDKLAEIITRFDRTYFNMKKERGGVDFNDLEHLALQVLSDPEASAAIREKYKLVFVDEYQDTNPVQEEIISKLCNPNSLFMVGDVKQSIYGFRGCEPDIFADKQAAYERDGLGEAVKLSDNFRSNREILNFVNKVFGCVMTEDFGKVNYEKDAQLLGGTEPSLLSEPSVRIDFVKPTSKEKREITEVYDITEETESFGKNRQAALIAQRVKQYVGKTYVDRDGSKKQIQYGDVVILFRTLQNKALAVYNALTANNVPVAANFNSDGYASKEIKDLINLLRVLDNPYNDLYLAGVCLSCFGGLTESELGCVRLDTDGRVPFYDRLIQYASEGKDNAIADKVNKLLKLLDELRFYSKGASVSEVALKTMELTDYRLYVQGLPNSGFRLRKLYDFVDGIKDASYAQTIDRFLSYVDESRDTSLDGGMGAANAVRILTMHASKGLEFPVVILADLEHGFHRDTDAVYCNFDAGLAIKYYDFGTMTYAPTLSSAAYSLLNAKKQSEEEMRLLYVAMTRAKFALDIVAGATEKQINGLAKLPQNATCHLDWILCAKDCFDECNAQVSVFGDELDGATTLDGQETTPLMCEQETDEQSVLSRLDFKYAFASQADMPVKVVSSALDKEYIGVNADYEETFVKDGGRNYVGTAYHKTLQYVDYKANREQIASTVEGLVRDGQIDRAVADKLDADVVYRVLNNPQFVQLTSAGEVYRELPFMLYAPYAEVSLNADYTDDVILQGVIDVLVICGGKAAVVDFKYTTHSDKVKDNYSAQMNSYKLAVQKICGIADVKCYVLSIEDNKLIEF